jgi:hypothetical protein
LLSFIGTGLRVCVADLLQCGVHVFDGIGVIVTKLMIKGCDEGTKR